VEPCRPALPPDETPDAPVGLRLDDVQRASRPTAETVFDIATWAREALAVLADLPGVRRVGLALTEGGGRRLRFTASDRESGVALDWCHVDAYDDVPLNTAVRMGEPVVGCLESLHEQYAQFVSRQSGTATVALAAIPIVASGQTLGGFVLFFDRPQAFDHGQRLGLEQLGVDLGTALRRAQRGEQRPDVPMLDQPVQPGAAVAVHDVAPDPAGVAGARRFLRSTLDAWGVDEETAYTAALCLSELVTNAVVHAQVGSVVRVLLEDGVLTTTVRDQGSAVAVSNQPGDDPLRVHGRGLQLVDTLATRWGSDLDNVGTTVWFVLEL
jgi:anti-sigma regulatory factor (Ser/Thr protein kinase)